MSALTLEKLLRARKKTLAVAESLTGGALMDALVRVPGASDVFLGGAVAYRDEIKRDVLGVRAGTLDRFTAVSAPCAREMARGARQRFSSDYAVATTGYAGPDGNPPGLIYIALACEKGERVYRLMLRGGRNTVRAAAVHIALYLLEKELYTHGEEGSVQARHGDAGNDPRE